MYYIYLHIYTYVHAYVYIYIYIYICSYTYVLIHTDTANMLELQESLANDVLDLLTKHLYMAQSRWMNISYFFHPFYTFATHTDSACMFSMYERNDFSRLVIAFIHIYIYTYIYIHTYIHTYLYACIYTFLYILIHTYT